MPLGHHWLVLSDFNVNRWKSLKKKWVSRFEITIPNDVEWIDANLNVYSFNEDLLDDLEENVNCVESYVLFLSCCDSNDKVSEHVLKSALQNAVTLCYARKELCSRFVNLIASSLLQNPSKLIII